jgi:predicted ATPase
LFARKNEHDTYLSIGESDTMHPQLTHIAVKGYKSLRELSLRLGPVTALIGANGAGKSNLLSLLRLLMHARTQSLQRFTAEAGGADRLLYRGPKHTKSIEIELTFTEQENTFQYQAELGYAATNSLFFRAESVSYNGRPSIFGGGTPESQLQNEADARGRNSTADLVNRMLARVSFYHFHDTSREAPLRQNARQVDNAYLRSDGSNLASVLYRLSTSDHDEYRTAWGQVQRLVKRIAPYLKRVEPTLVAPEYPETSPVRLLWRDTHDHTFDTHDLSDGTLRALALFTALSQPSTKLPAFLCIDEPELGLHPAALSLFAELVNSLEGRCWVLLATQSPALLDLFAPEQVVVVEQADNGSTFTRLDSGALSSWLEEYSFSELFDKNVLGGRP